MGPEVEEFIEEPEYFFRFSATLRIFGDIGDLEAITAELGVCATHVHRRGEKPLPSSLRVYEHDMWPILRSGSEGSSIASPSGSTLVRCSAACRLSEGFEGTSLG